jgi:hypothetical protein
MTYTQSLPTFTVEFSQLNDLAKQLRQLGAKFNAHTDRATQRSVLSFKVLPKTALKLLVKPPAEAPAIADPWDEPLKEADVPVAPVVTASAPSKATPMLLLPPGTPTQTWASTEQLQGLSKTRLKKLAKRFRIQGRSQMDTEQLVAALVGQVSAADL